MQQRATKQTPKPHTPPTTCQLPILKTPTKHFIFFNDTATTEIYTIAYTLSLHDALP
eukprot:COSAG01_NODE_71429_length_256_cov_0.503185_1_plen_56_part_10